MTNYAANIFTVRAPLATLEAVARYMGCKSQRDADGALRFDLTGRHDAAAYESGDELARRFPDARILCAYPPHARAWFFGAVDTYGGFGSSTAVSLDIVRHCVPVLPHWVITEWERAERKRVATSGGAEERAAEEGEAGEILF